MTDLKGILNNKYKVLAVSFDIFSKYSDKARVNSEFQKVSTNIRPDVISEKDMQTLRDLGWRIYEDGFLHLPLT